MSMYTQLLSAAMGQCPPEPAVATEDDAVDAVLRCRAELESAPPPADPDAVSVVLALEVAYDVALIRLARLVAMQSDPDRFEQPQLERARLEMVLRDRGLRLEPSMGDGEPSPVPR